MMIGQHEFAPKNFVPIGRSLVSYDNTNRCLVPSVELEAWLKENARGPWVIGLRTREDGRKEPVIRFVDDRDPIFFKLWWSEHS